MDRVPLRALKAQSKTGWWSARSPGAPSMVSSSSMNWRIPVIASAE
jgi:hypothetical protein